MTNNITSAAAMLAALEYADLNIEETCDRRIALHDGLYEISFRTMFMVYEVYVDALTADVPGFNAEPAMPNKTYSGLRMAA